jgi:hypothetical protein
MPASQSFAVGPIQDHHEGYRKFEFLNDWFDNHYPCPLEGGDLCGMLSNALLMSLIFIQLYACNENKEIARAKSPDNPSSIVPTKMKITIGTNIFTATLFNNETAAAFKAKLPITINMTELNGNEKYVDFPDNLPTDPSNPGTIQTGDLMIYGSRTLVLFYKTFSTSYIYTRLGRIDDPSGLADVLGSGNKTVKFELE